MHSQRLPAVLSTLFTSLLLGACSNQPESATQHFVANPNFQIPIPSSHLSVDQQFAKIALDEPGFAGYYYDENGILTARVKGGKDATLQQSSLSSSTLAKTIAQVAGKDILEPTLLASNVKLLSVNGALRRKPAAPQLRVVEANFDLFELASARDFIRNTPSLMALAINSIDLDEIANRVALGVDTLSDKRLVSNELSRLKLQSITVVRVNPRPRETASNLRSFINPIRGGIQTQGQGVGPCTIGFPTVVEGQPGFITASHCTNGLGLRYTSFDQPITGYDYLGYEYKDVQTFRCGLNSSQTCRHADVAFINISSSGNTMQLGKIASVDQDWYQYALINGYYTIDGTANPVVGQTLFKVGRSTGRTYGKVTHVDVDQQSTENIWQLKSSWVKRPAGITRAIVVGGDSGAPVFSINSGLSVKLRGVLWGGEGADFVFSPIGQIVKGLGSNIRFF